jgi:hypothetical protein
MFKYKLNVHICPLTRREGITLLAVIVSSIVTATVRDQHVMADCSLCIP